MNAPAPNADGALPFDPFEGQLQYSDRTQAKFELDPDCLCPDKLKQAGDDCVANLSAVLAIDDHTAMRSADEEKDQAADFARLERKVDLLLEMFSRSISGADDSDLRNLQISAWGVRWTAPQGELLPKPGTLGFLSIQMHRLCPRPIRLPAEVMADAPMVIRLRLINLGSHWQEVMERFVFQQHRRNLALNRRRSGLG